MEDFVLALKCMSPNAVKDYIRSELSRDGERLRFEMSGYDSTTSARYEGEYRRTLKGTCVVHNQKVLNTFAHLGIYDYTVFMSLDFYKGHPTLYWCYWGQEGTQTEEFGGYTTTDIIYEVFKLTILSDACTRRRT